MLFCGFRSDHLKLDFIQLWFIYFYFLEKVVLKAVESTAGYVSVCFDVQLKPKGNYCSQAGVIQKYNVGKELFHATYLF